MEAAQHGHRRDSTRLGMVVFVGSSRDALTDALMRPGVIVETYEFGDEAMQLVAVENKHVVQAFPFEGADEAFAVSVGRQSLLHPNGTVRSKHSK
jgi:hypothetical protein